MSYYLIEGQGGEDQNNPEPFNYMNIDIEWKDCAESLDVGDDYKSKILGEEDKCGSLTGDDAKCISHVKGDEKGNYFRCELSENPDLPGQNVCVDPNMLDETKRVCKGPRTRSKMFPSNRPIETPLGNQIDDLNTMFKDKNLPSVLIEQINEINETIPDKSKLYNSNDLRSGEYINKIKNMSSIYDLGDPNNSDELDFMENIIINFLDIPNNRMGDLFKNYCSEDLNVTVLLSLAVFYNNSGDYKGNIVNVDRLLNRLGRYLPDVFQNILTGMKTCYPNEPNKYAVLEHIYKKMFKFNETNVDLGLMDGVTNIFRYLKEMKTIEMVVIIIAFAFVVSKIFDMFRVKVDV